MIHITNNRSICDSLRGVLGAMLLLLSLTGCEKDTEPSNFAPALTTGGASDIYRVGATLSGSINRSEATVVQEYGILLSELKSMAEYNELKATDGNNSFSLQVQNLQPGKTYYYCAYAYSGYSHARGEVKEFTTTESNAPVFGEIQISGKDEKSFTASCKILDEGGSELFLTGFCYKKADQGGEPTAEDNTVNVAVQNSTITAQLKDLTPGEEYLLRAYGINGNGRGYSETVHVTLNEATTPVVSSSMAIDSTATSVTVEAHLLSRGTSEVIEHGFCWSAETANPTIANLKLSITGSAEKFSGVINSLKANSTYYIRAYAINEQGIGYGDILTFHTPVSLIPEMNAVSISEIGTTTVKAMSNVLNNNDLPIVEKGFCLSESNTQPTTGDRKISVTGSDNNFQTVIDGLKPATTYYICSYATNEAGVGYSEAIEFKTELNVNTPAIDDLPNQDW